jgi:membrane associated rhomboid family serine protease
MELKYFGKSLIAAGAVLVVFGIVFWLAPRMPVWFGRLPGDISVQKKNFSFYFPLATCLLVSFILSLIMWLVGKR